MVAKEIALDEEAEKLFQSLAGLDMSDKSLPTKHQLEELDEGLREEEARLDVFRILLVELTHMLSIYFRDVQYWEEERAEAEHFTAIIRILRDLGQMPGHDNTVLIRYRGMPADPKLPVRNDYVLIFGSIRLDLDSMPVIAKRQGTRGSHLQGRLSKAFQSFSDIAINNVFLDITAENPASLEHLLTCLRMLSRYNQALEDDVPVVFKKGDNAISLPIIRDESGKPDVNLTLVAGLNGLNAQTMQSLVKKVHELMQQAEANSTWEPHASVFGAMFSVRQLREQLTEPPIAVNNAKWLMVDSSYDGISREKAQMVRFVMSQFGGTPHDTVRVINSVYGKDYSAVTGVNLASRIESATDLLDSLAENEKSTQFEQEALRNIQGRMGQVQDKVYGSLSVQDDTVIVQEEEEQTVFRRLNSRLLRMAQFYIRRSKTRQKVKSIVSQRIDFDSQDYEILGRDFGIPTESAEHLVNLLKACFDGEGRFRRSAFERSIPEFVRYERKIFDFLWHYAKATPHRNDRVTFLNSLQLLTTQMRKPHRAVYSLINDFYRDPEELAYSDRNCLMLSNLFLRKYNKELNLDIELTPEEILLVKEGLNDEVVRMTSAMIDRDQEKLFAKIRAIHQATITALSDTQEEGQAMSVKYLLSLEREVHIFLSLLKGLTARSVIRNAAKIYGFPEAGVYHLGKSREHLSLLLQHLKVVVRGLGRTGERKDLALLEEIRSSEGGFLGLSKSVQHEELIKRTMEWVDVARFNLSQEE